MPFIIRGNSSSGGGGGSGEANTGSNLGAGSQVYASKLGTALQFRTLSNADSAIGVTTNGNIVEIGLDQSKIDTDNITEGVSNKFYSETLFNNSFSGKSTDDLTEGSTNLYLTSAEQTKLGYISVTQAVDLDQLESDVNNLSAHTHIAADIQPLDSEWTNFNNHLNL